MEKLEMTKELESVLQSIRDGEVYAHVESVAPSGMSRRILFYRINTEKYDNAPETDEGYILRPYIQRITAEIGWLCGELKAGEYKQGGKYVYEAGLRVGGCGMDMIFNTLYRCIPYEELGKWSQKYNTL
jgi:hypothetical protein